MTSEKRGQMLCNRSAHFIFKPLFAIPRLPKKDNAFAVEGARYSTQLLSSLTYLGYGAWFEVSFSKFALKWLIALI